MTQNIYDDEAFFTAYSRLPRSREGLDGAPEWPALRALLPPLASASVLDLGCGFGWFARFARTQGAAHVRGVDVSERMLARAKAETTDTAITYEHADLEHVAIAPQTHDLVYSSLVFHYVQDLGGLLARVRSGLKNGGVLIFSAEHPIMTAPENPGWLTDAEGRKAWPVSGYLDEGPRATNWLVDGVIKQHRTIATYVALLLRAGFAISHLEEWSPSAAQVAAHPEWVSERARPFFLLMRASV
ncbi:MAG: class I SAM-dependent methyltransferase [Variibacter sp.]